MKLKFGMSSVVTGAGAGDFAEVTEDLGFDAIWLGEHIANFRPCPTIVPILGAFAARTKRIRIGSGAILLPLRNPVVIAKELATLDHISGGRLVLGVGAGGDNPAEFEACGVAMSERFGRLNEMMEILPRLWREDNVVYEGKYYKLPGVTIDPKPVQPGGPKLIVAGRREGAMRRAVRYAGGFMPYLYTPEQCAKAMEYMRGFASETGRDLTGFELVISQFICLAGSKDEARRISIEWISNLYQQDFTNLVDRYAVMGTPSDCIERLNEYAEAGVQHVILAPVPGNRWDRALIEPIAREVVAKMR